MKKVIRSRSETTDSGSLLLEALERTAPPLSANIESTTATADIQPPLPPDPSPPDSPISPRTPKPKMPKTNEIKKEAENSECENNNQTAPEQETREVERENSDQTTEKREICRDYIRGNCKRQDTCKFEHKVDLSQLEGVYTFCWEYQNSICPYRDCKYVHASVFEERHFYRTGILSPSANHRRNVQPADSPSKKRRHKRKARSALPRNVDFSSPPPPLPSDIYQPPNMPSTSSGAIGPYFVEERNNIPQTVMEHGLNTTDTFPVTLRERAHLERMVNTCTKCEEAKMRLRYNLDKVNKMKESKEKLSKRMAVLDKKNAKLLAIILSVVRPTDTSVSNTSSRGTDGDSNADLMDLFNMRQQE